MPRERLRVAEVRSKMYRRQSYFNYRELIVTRRRRESSHSDNKRIFFEERESRIAVTSDINVVRRSEASNVERSKIQEDLKLSQRETRS